MRSNTHILSFDTFAALQMECCPRIEHLNWALTGVGSSYLVSLCHAEREYSLLITLLMCLITTTSPVLLWRRVIMITFAEQLELDFLESFGLTLIVMYFADICTI
jgi:hypothetical protein